MRNSTRHMKGLTRHPANRNRQRGEGGQAILLAVAVAAVFLAAGTSVALTVVNNVTTRRAGRLERHRHAERLQRSEHGHRDPPE
jgi:hypothetical protein